MADELTHKKDNIDRVSRAVASSLLGRIQKIKETREGHTLLIDLSGSMDDRVYEEGKESEGYTTKYTILQALMTKIPEGVRMFWFSDNCEEFSGSLPPTKCGTAMDVGFDTVKSRGINEIVLITDGIPNDAREALKSSQGLKIDIIYIGSQPQPDFLATLAGRTGGSFTNINLIKAGSTKELENKVLKYLNA